MTTKVVYPTEQIKLPKLILSPAKYLKGALLTVYRVKSLTAGTREFVNYHVIKVGKNRFVSLGSGIVYKLDNTLDHSVSGFVDVSLAHSNSTNYLYEIFQVDTIISMSEETNVVR